MSEKLSQTPELKKFLQVVSGQTSDKGDARAKSIVHRIVSDLYRTIDDFDIQPEEFWTAVGYLNELGQRGEAGLLAPGLGFDHFLDLRMDAEDAAIGVKSGTPRTIEGPLYVAGAPRSLGEARLDDGKDEGEVLFMHGVVRAADGAPIRGAVVDVWQANTKGMYSFFDKSQSDFNLRRQIETDAEGRYSFRSIVPSGYGCPPDGPTQALLTRLGRHGRRPAHIHFFVSAPGYRHLTTQINIAGDEYLHDDFAFATRDDLIAEVERRADPAAIKAKGVKAPYAEIDFDFTLTKPIEGTQSKMVERKRASAG
jgi:catechol 1,2-dioxygenase